MQPQAPSSGSNPYEFITSPNKPVKKSLFGGGTSGKLFPILILVVIVVVVLAIGASLLGGGSSKDDYTKLLQQQAEILRISDLGLKDARGSGAKNFTITTKETIYSQQGTLTKLAASAKVKLKPKVLAAGKNANTDKKLTDAQQTNKYDEVLVTILKDNLKQYQQTLKKIYDSTSKKATKTTLDESYAAVQILINAQTQDVNSGTAADTPATN